LVSKKFDLYMDYQMDKLMLQDSVSNPLRYVKTFLLRFLNSKEPSEATYLAFVTEF